MRVSVFGLGYVGAVAGACLAETGHDVIAIDKDPVKVKCIEESRSPIVEPGLAEMIRKNIWERRLRSTLDCDTAIRESDVSLLCVGTPSRADGSLDLSHVESVCAEIGTALKKKSDYHIVVLRSTVIPGSCRDVAIPALEKSSGKKAGTDFGFAHNPEFLREGTAIADYFSPPKIVIGAEDEKSVEAMKEIYKGIDAPLAVTSVDVAEGVKYADNAWHAMKIGFANELGNILKEHGVDSHKVMDIFFLDTKLNISKAYLKPGFAFGGSCLPKDVRALRASAANKNLKTPIFDSLLAANDEQVRRAHRMIREKGHKKIGMMGLSFKAGTDDLRESPLVTLADLLIRDGAELAIYDPHVQEAAGMDGANRAYIRDSIPHISRYLVPTPEEFLDKSEIFVIGHHGENFREILERDSGNRPVIDLVRLKDSAALQSRKSYAGICW